MCFDLPAARFDFGAREGLIDALDLLKAGHIRLTLVQPLKKSVEPRLDAVDVPCGDQHRNSP